ncbi:RHS repeat domain-containing protein [Shewanella woodyi]|uniref:RHS repeat domain-containing protein n=1 Tax=Shewanella woodyi TaxID=60961 RepID=UPI0037484D83
MADQVFTYANNYNGFATGDVNERTGSFDFSIHLVKINANKLKGPELEINTSIDTFNQQDHGFGPGLKLSLSKIDLINHIFTNSSGVSIKLDIRNILPAEPCLNDFKIEYNSRVKEYKVSYIDGQKDFLKTDGQGKFANLVRKENALGNGVNFRWSSTNQLIEIKDDSGFIFLSVKKIGTGGAKEVGLLGGKYFVFINSNEKLTTLSLPYENQGAYQNALNYKIVKKYDGKSNVYCIDEVLLPDETAHKLIYGQYLSLPARAGFTSLPVVTEHSLIRSGQTIRKTNFDFLLDGNQGNNAYGLGASVPYQAYSDTMYRIKTPYFYRSQKTSVDHEGHSLVTTQKFDKFHNIREAKIEYKNCITTEEITYFSTDNGDISTQDPRLKLIKNHKKQFSNNGSSRTESIYYQFDSYGNLLNEYDPEEGVSITYEYYNTLNGAIDNAIEKCPKYDFIYFLKSQSITDTKTDETRIVSRRKYSPLHDAVCIEEDKNEYSQTNVSYNYCPAGDNLGRISAIILESNNHQNREESLYEIIDSKLKVTTTTSCSSEANDSIKNFTLFNMISGEIVEKNEQGKSVRLDYYFDGRLKAEITAPNSEYECKKEYTYFDSQSKIEEFDSYGNKKTTQYDALGQVREVYLTIPGVIENYLNISNEFNSLGQQVTETQYDKTLPSKLQLPIAEQTWALTKKFEYDGWGECFQVTLPDGQIQIDQFDPISLKQVTGTAGQPYSVNQRDPLNRQVITEQFDQHNQKMNVGSTTVYDGFGRIRNSVNHLGVNQDFGHDLLNRVTSTRVHYQHNANFIDFTTSKIYSPYHTSIDFIESVSLDNIKLGQRNFDGFGRLMDETIGQTQTSYHYSAGAIHFHKVKLSNGQEVDAHFNSEIGDYTQLGLKHYIPDNLRGSIRNAVREDTGNHVDYEYRFDGLTSIERNHCDIQHYEYTLFGFPVASKFSDTDYELIEYDNFQRVKSTFDGSNTVNYMNYDQFSRVTKIIVTGANPIEINHDYSKFPYEVVTTSTQETHQLIETRQFTDDGKVRVKLTTLNGDTLTEHFEYDPIGRLASYRADGARSPKDQYENTIVSQVFRYDNLNNIRHVTTVFDDSSVDNSELIYDINNPAQLMRISHTHASYEDVDLSHAYNEFGKLTQDEKGLQYSYDEYGEMRAIYDEHGLLISSYEYDAVGRLISQSINNEPDLELIYSGNKLIGQKQGELRVQHLLADNRLIGKKFSSAEIQLVSSYLTDSSNTPISVSRKGDINNTENYLYTAYGYRHLLAPPS